METEKYRYQKVYASLLSDICSGVLKPDTRLPKDVELAQRFGVSTITITHALNALKADGYVSRIKGSGSFVRLPQTPRADGASPAPAPDCAEENGESALLGLVLEHATSCFGLDMLYAMDEKAMQADCRLLTRFSYGIREKETQEIEFLLRQGIRGLIVMPCHGSYYSESILKLVLDGFPVVLIDKKMDGIPIVSVRTDGAAAMEQLVEHLAAKGCRHIGFIATEADATSSVQERRQGFYHGLERRGLPRPTEGCLKVRTFRQDYSDNLCREDVEDIRQYLTEQRNTIDSVICTEYGIARCAWAAAGEIGWRQLPILCMDENYLAPEIHFTHVRQNEREIAEKAMQQLFSMMDGKKKESKDILVPGLFRLADSERA